MTGHVRGAYDPIERAVRSRPCRRCHAATTAPCTNHPSGKKMHISHAARYDDATEAGDLEFLKQVPICPPGFVL